MKNKLTAIFIVAIATLISSFNAGAQNPGEKAPRISEIDRTRLAETFRLGDRVGDRVWKGWNKTPFSVLLITEDHEFLIRHPKPSPDFALAGYDTLLKSKVYFRKRRFDPALLAAFPFNGVPTIVVGRAENTGKTSSGWVITLLHEHFHQFQTSRQDYNSEVAALDLARGDTSGMWMLNYAFPYKDEKVAAIYKQLAAELFDILKAGDLKKAELDARVKSYLSVRRKLKETLSPEDYKYFSLQIWQEGIARYTEHRIADYAAHSYKPTKDFRELKDFKPFAEVEKEVRLGNLNELRALTLPAWKRTSFYSVGAGEGLLLDRLSPRWKSRYFSEKFYVENYFK